MRCKAPQPFEISEFDELHEHSSSNASVLERLSKELDSRLKDQRGHCTFHVAVVRTATRTPKQHTNYCVYYGGVSIGPCWSHRLSLKHLST